MNKVKRWRQLLRHIRRCARIRDDDSTEDSTKVGLKVYKKELTTIVIDIMERYMKPASKIVLKEFSAGDLAQSTAASEAELKNK